MPIETTLIIFVFFLNYRGGRYFTSGICWVALVPFYSCFTHLNKLRLASTDLIADDSTDSNDEAGL